MIKVPKTAAKRIHTPIARKGTPGQAGLKNVEGKAQRRRQYVSTARSCNAAIGIFSGPRLRPAVVTPCAFKYMAQQRGGIGAKTARLPRPAL
ncbi:hypothetical protein [Janthinobacterium sp. PSPC3-1]|uniref:hypothetical protein n=1 Tax=Janthinobacterium sp. PSPC3-1 TaxID=2804653 RepID=UPI003CF4413F